MRVNRGLFFNHFSNKLPTKQGEIYCFLYTLWMQGLLYHLDDDPAEVISTQAGGRLFTDEECTALRSIVDSVFANKENLLDYEKDPFTICLQLMHGEGFRPPNLPMPPVPLLPLWGFSFDETPDNYFRALTYPNIWNGWGLPLMNEQEIYKLDNELGKWYEFNYHGVGRDRKIEVRGENLGDDVVTLTPQFIMKTDKMMELVFSVGDLGLTFNIGDCLEIHRDRWEGFF